MPVERPIDLDGFAVPEELTLIVAWEQGESLVGGQVRTVKKVGAHLRSAAQKTVEIVNARELRAYTPDMQLEDEEAISVVDPELIGDSPVAEVVLPTTPPQLVSAQSLPKRALRLYAVHVCSEDGEPLAFVRKSNPHRALRAGHIFTMLGDSLTPIGGPVFGLDPFFDMVVCEQGVIALNQAHYELLFRETPVLQQQIPQWVDSIHSLVPIAADGAKLLAERASTDGRLRRRLRSIAERGHLEQVTIERIRQHLKEADLSEQDFLDGDQLRYDDANPFGLVYMLNEDFFCGGLTDTAFRSDRKSPR
jgi:hypothetical protein